MLKTEQDKIKEALSLSQGISDIISGQADAENQHTVDSWIAENERNKDLFDKICSEDTMQKKIHNYKNSDAEQAFDKFLKARTQRSKRRILYRVLSGAATIALCLGLWTLVQLQKQKTQPLQVATTEQHATDMSENKPVLTLGDGTQMNVWGDNLHFKETEKGQKIMLGDSLLSQRDDSTTTESYNTLEVPAMCDFHFTLSDGTKVWMNAASTLKYPTKFAADSRTIFASGEIYLEVAKDAKRPFYVAIDGITIKVLGTSFNIRAYENENDTKVTLIEGKLKVNAPSGEYYLLPGEHYSSAQSKVYKVDPEFYISWTEGAMEFDAMPFPLLIARLSRCYNVDIQIASKELETMKFTGVIFRNKPLDFALDIIHRVSDVKFEKKGETILVKKQ